MPFYNPKGYKLIKPDPEASKKFPRTFWASIEGPISNYEKVILLELIKPMLPDYVDVSFLQMPPANVNSEETKLNAYWDEFISFKENTDKQCLVSIASPFTLFIEHNLLENPKYVQKLKEAHKFYKLPNLIIYVHPSKAKSLSQITYDNWFKFDDFDMDIENTLCNKILNDERGVSIVNLYWDKSKIPEKIRDEIVFRHTDFRRCMYECNGSPRRSAHEQQGLKKRLKRCNYFYEKPITRQDSNGVHRLNRISFDKIKELDLPKVPDKIPKRFYASIESPIASDKIQKILDCSKKKCHVNTLNFEEGEEIESLYQFMIKSVERHFMHRCDKVLLTSGSIWKAQLYNKLIAFTERFNNSFIAEYQEDEEYYPHVIFYLRSTKEEFSRQYDGFFQIKDFTRCDGTQSHIFIIDIDDFDWSDSEAVQKLFDFMWVNIYTAYKDNFVTHSDEINEKELFTSSLDLPKRNSPCPCNKEI